MSEVRLPRKISGEWIWRAEPADSADLTLMFRREFICNSVGDETNLWISARDTYQVFINGRFLGFGPRAHQSPGHSYIDQHEITYFLESGINVVAVLVSRNVLAAEAEAEEMKRRSPGLWCQISTDRDTLTATDRTWQVGRGDCYVGHRARIAPDQGLAPIFNAGAYPEEWLYPIAKSGVFWTNPNRFLALGEPGAKLELHPLAPPAIADEHPEFQSCARGRFQ